MKCPRCGSEMELDIHRKIPLNMCYNCGYIEGRNTDGLQLVRTNFEHLISLNLNDAAAFVAEGLKAKGVDIEEKVVADWLVEAKV